PQTGNRTTREPDRQPNGPTSSICHHRVKTHAGWTVTQPRTGTWLWRTPHGQHYLVDHNGTTPLGKL
ncbi:MAG: hypothetical protein WKF54_06960, partial [Nocardioidaceae bacterium]